MVRIPPYLRPGDTIAITCPGGFMPEDRARVCIDTLAQWGYRVRIGKTLSNASDNYFAGTDEERLADLQQMLDDGDVKAILCGRGGYGLGRIIDHIDFSAFRKNPKWIVGYSDVTVLHAHIHRQYKIATMHAPMAGAFNEGGHASVFIRGLHTALSGGVTRYMVSPHPLNKKGEAIGELVGGNLSLLAHLVGSASEIKTKGKILFLEDVSEYLYHIDRMMYQLKRSGRLDKLAGLIVGGFTDMKDTERPFGKTVYEIVREVVADYDFPVCFDFPLGHQMANVALKSGLGYKLKVGKNKVTLEE